MYLFEEVIPNFVLLFKETNFVSNFFGKITVYEGLIPTLKVKRVYVINEVRSGMTRGHHSHKELHQLLISLNGSISVVVDNGFIQKTVQMDSANRALYIGPNVWHTMTWNDNSASLLVLASELYDEEDYIRDYDKFISLVRNEDYSI